MRSLLSLLPLLLGIVPAFAAEDATTTDSRLTLDGSITTTISEATVPTGDYLTYASTVTLSTDSNGGVHTSTITGTGTAAGTTTGTRTGNSTETTGRATTTSQSYTLLVGGETTIIGNGTANATMTSSAPSTSTSPVVNTRPCNGYPELCSRSYSNITMVAAHNSPFVRPGNLASNQELGVLAQLNDGIRMLQFQVHLINGTMYLCHTTCDLLDAGTLEAYLTTVSQWMRQHPYDVVTILLGNYGYVEPGNFTAPFQNSGLLDMVYTPSKIPMGLDDWPTLSSMILSGKRVVVFMDYQANQTEVPWLMDEFSQMWETPFSPTDREFPCIVQRPPGLAVPDAKSRMYMANHNLNIEVNIATISMLIPNTAYFQETNAVSGYGSLGRMANNCTERWNRPPNFLLVDYYNYGNFNGSVFAVAAEMNNLTYNGKCCDTTSAAPTFMSGPNIIGMMMAAAGLHFLAALF